GTHSGNCSVIRAECYRVHRATDGQRRADRAVSFGFPHGRVTPEANRAVVARRGENRTIRIERNRLKGEVAQERGPYAPPIVDAPQPGLAVSACGGEGLAVRAECH